MRGLRYLDFDLMFQRVEHGYLARVLSSPAGQASSEFALPFSDLEIENFLLRFGRTRQPMRRLGSSQLEAARSFGGRLFEATFQNEVRSCLRSSLEEAQRQELGLRLRLRLAEAPELNDLPWEFLLQPSLGRFLALSAETPLVRYLDLPERVRPLAVKPPLEVLTVISSPSDYAPLEVEDEWRNLSASLEELQARGLLRLHRLATPTLAQLQRWLRRETCHVLHFIGHGGFDARTEDGLLLFSDEKGKGREVSGAALGTLLHDHRPLRLAVLNACEGARSSRTDPFAGVAQSLVREGIPAVVAMQFEITDRAAIEFAHELYTAVVDGYPIDAALGEARKALYFGGNELEWGTPVLYMRAPDGQLFEIDAATPVDRLDEVDTAPEPGPRVEELPLPQVEEQPPRPDPPTLPTPAPPELSVGGAVEAADLANPASTEAGPRPAPRPRRPVRWRGLAALLGVMALALLYWTIRGRGGESGEAAKAEEKPVAAEAPARVLPSPSMVRAPGVFLTTSVKKGDPVRASVLEVVEAASRQDQPATLDNVVGGCFVRDLEKGHKLTWNDVGSC